MSDFTLIDILNLIRAEIRKTQIGPIKKVTGPQGPQGIQGESGSVGPQGPRGNDGKPGPMGPKGNQGRKGDKGAKGEDGEDGVGIARIEQDIDNAIIVILTDGSAYTIEMPIVKGDGNPAEVHYKVAGGGTTQIIGPGKDDVDLSGYVKVPEGFGDKWLVYNEATQSWAVATTDLISTNSAEVFRDSQGRFKSTKTLPDLHNQLEVNRFIGVELEAQAATDEAQWHEINDIKVELEALAPTRELGHWTISSAIPEEPEMGMVHFDPLDLSADETDMYIHCLDSDNKRHSFAQVEIGDYIEAVGDNGFGLWLTNAEVVDHNNQPDIKMFALTLVKSEGVLAVGDKVDIKAFHLADTDLDLSDLDERYARKEAEHFNISHQSEIGSWYNRPHKFFFGTVPKEQWYSSYERILPSEKGGLCISSKSPTTSGTLDAKTWQQLKGYAGGNTTLYLRRVPTDLEGTALSSFSSTTCRGSVIVLKQAKSGAELSLHVKNVLTRTGDGMTEEGLYVSVRRASGAATDDDPWKLYQQQEYLSSKGHDHFIGTLNTREDRTLRKWKSLGSGEFAISDNTSTPNSGDGCYSWDRLNWFKIYSGAFSNSVISGDYGNGLGIFTFQKSNTIYSAYITASECMNTNGDHTWRGYVFGGRYKNSTITEWDTTFTVSTNGLLQNTRTQIKESQSTNVYTVGSPDEDIENPERPIWTGDNFGDFKGLDEFVAELKSADPEGSSIEFLMEQWQTYWYTQGR